MVQQRTPPKAELFNLAKDPAETTDLSGQNTAKVAELTKLYDAWLDQMAPPMSGAPKRFTGTADRAKKAKRAGDDDSGGKKKKKKQEID